MHYSLRSLQIFESMARHGTLRDAAHELGITQGAVSQQIHKLSEDVGEALFVKAGRQLVLTPQGKKLAKALRLAFQEIDNSISQTIGNDKPMLRVAFCSTIGTSWLLPKCKRFLQEQKLIGVQFSMFSEQPDLSESVGDVFITTSAPPIGYWTRELLEERLVPVAKNEELLQKFWSGELPLISTEMENGIFGRDWEKWVSLTGMPLSQMADRQFLRSSHFVFSRDMAIQGLGMALVPDFLAESFVEKNALVELPQYAVKSDRTYYVSVKQSRRYEDVIQAFIKWLLLSLNTRI